LPKACKVVPHPVGVLAAFEESGVGRAASGFDCLGQAVVEPGFEAAERHIKVL